MNEIESSFTLNPDNIFLSLHLSAKKKAEQMIKVYKDGTQVYNTAVKNEKEWINVKEGTYQVGIDYSVPGRLLFNDEQLLTWISTFKDDPEEAKKEQENRKKEYQKEQQRILDNALVVFQEYFLWFSGEDGKKAVSKENIKTVMAPIDKQVDSFITNNRLFDMNSMIDAAQKKEEQDKENEEKYKEWLKNAQKQNVKLVCVISYKIDQEIEKTGATK